MIKALQLLVLLVKGVITDVVRLLIERGASVKYQNKVRGLIPEVIVVAVYIMNDSRSIN